MRSASLMNAPDSFCQRKDEIFFIKNVDNSNHRVTEVSFQNCRSGEDYIEWYPGERDDKILHRWWDTYNRNNPATASLQWWAISRGQSKSREGGENKVSCFRGRSGAPDNRKMYKFCWWENTNRESKTESFYFQFYCLKSNLTRNWAGAADTYCGGSSASLSSSWVRPCDTSSNNSILHRILNLHLYFCHE